MRCVGVDKVHPETAHEDFSITMHPSTKSLFLFPAGRDWSGPERVVSFRACVAFTLAHPDILFPPPPLPFPATAVPL